MLKLLLTYLLIFCFAIVSSSQTSESQVKAGLIYKFAQYIEWHDEQAIDTFKFGLITQDTILIQSFKIISETAKLRLKPIRQILLEKNTDYNNLQCVFVDYNDRVQLSKVIKQIQSRNVLIITYSTADLLLSMVNIYKSDDDKTLKFEVNKQNLDDNGFTYKPELLFYGGSFVDIKELYVSTNQQLATKNLEIDSVNKDLVRLKVEEQEYKDSLLTISNQMQLVLQNINNKESEVNKLNLNINERDSNLKSLNIALNKQKKNEQKLSKQLNNQKDSILLGEASLNRLNEELEDKRNEIKDSEILINSQVVKIKTQKKGLILGTIIGVALIVIVVLIIIALKAKRLLATRLTHLVDKRTKDLNESQQYYLSLFENTPVAICEFDMTLLVEHLNASKNVLLSDSKVLEATKKIKINDTNFHTLELYSAISKQEFIAKYYSLFNKQSVKGLKLLYSKLLNRELQFEYEISRLSLRGEVKHLLQKVTVLPDGKEKYSKVLVSMLDITKIKVYEQEILRHRNHLEDLVKERTKEVFELNNNLTESNLVLKEQKEELLNTLNQLKDTQLQLIESEKMASLGMLTAGVAHEINNPVNFISSGNQALEMLFDDIWAKIDNFRFMSSESTDELVEKVKIFSKEVDDEDYYVTIKEIIDNMQIGVTRITEIVNSLQSYSRNSDIDKSDFDVHDTIDSALVMLNNKYKNRVEITKSFGSIPQILSSSSKLNQVFVNILSNAFDAIDGSGVVEIITKHIEKHSAIEIVVKDSGAGISKDDLGKIFEAFYTTKEPGKGTGLGMYITYGIISQLKGNIKIESEVGKGTKVIITLPIR